MLNISTPYTIDNVIPLKDSGYVITMDGTIHMLKYKFSHAYIIANLFSDRLGEYNLNLNDLDIDNSMLLAGAFAFDMPTIRVSRTMPYSSHTYIYEVWYNKDLTTESISALRHILYNVYGVDGYEKVESPSHNCSIRNINSMMAHVREQKVTASTLITPEVDNEF